jgi:hypothetical protein
MPGTPLLLGALIVLDGCFFRCSNTLSAVTQNPKGPSFAVLFTRDCGATTGWATHVSVVPRPSVGHATTGNVFVADGGSPQDPGVEVAWTSVRT